MEYKELRIHIPWPKVRLSRSSLSTWFPTRGNVLFTLVIIGILIWAQNAGAIQLAAPSTASTGTIAYQGRLASAGGAPLTQTIGMEFRLYNAATGGAPLWTEQWTGSNSVQVSDGLFNVMLGSLTSIPQSVIAGNSNLFLGITVGTDGEMSPRVQLGSVPFAVQALTVPDGSITSAKLAADVSLVPPTGSITTTMIADGAVTKAKLAGGVSEETLYTLTLSSWTNTTASTTASFGTINLPVESNLYVMSMWTLQNNSSEYGMHAGLVVDGSDHFYGVVPFAAAGIGYTISRNHYITNLAAGEHTFGVKIGQFPFRSGDSIHVGPPSVIWIRAVPVK